MAIERLLKAKGYRLFRDYRWPGELPPFARYNVIYGWNRSGKTTFSTVLRHVEQRTPIDHGDVEIEIAGRTINGNALAKEVLPDVRVFNRDFVAANLLEAAGIAPIYFLGAEDVAKQQEVARLKGELARANQKLDDARIDSAACDRALDQFCIERARTIKAQLTSARVATYNNYDKRSFIKSIGALQSKADAQAALVTPTVHDRLQQKRNAEPKLPVAALSIATPAIGDLAAAAAQLLAQNVVAHVLTEVAKDAAVGQWVQTGLELHSGDRQSASCRFCGSALSDVRRKALEDHFNDAVADLQARADALLVRVDSSALALNFEATDSSRLQTDLVIDYECAVGTCQQAAAEFGRWLTQLRERLAHKRRAPFEPADASVCDVPPDPAEFDRAAAAVNEMIERHNTACANFQREVEHVSATLEKGYVAESYDDYQALRQKSTNGHSVLGVETSQAAALTQRIDNLERDIVEHQRPAAELNEELRVYLGSSELQFAVRDTGYELSRDGQPAQHLSEGERSALAFLYFLKSLQDKSFDLSRGIVVIDDPVSSLDSNALFSAFAYMKERTRQASQLFILTHNLAFFRLIKNWFHHMPGQRKTDVMRRPARFYMMTAATIGSSRTATLGALDPLLEQHESEYHFLFKQIYVEANRADVDTSLARYYGMPNMARRLLEAFMSFRDPRPAELAAKLDALTCDAAAKNRIVRFLNAYSHSAAVPEPSHDLAILSETKAMLTDVLALIASLNPIHYERMVESTK